jgi:hypothetical protein
MLCKFCGTPVKYSGSTGGLWGERWGPNCPASANKKHVGSSGTSMFCKYCGDEVKSSSGTNPGLWSKKRGPVCPASPNKKHELPG